MAKRILHADDEPMVLGVTSAVLRHEGYEIHHANDGQEAVDTAKLMLANGGLDLVLMDMRMPKKNGLEAIKEIRTFSETQIPIIILSGHMPDEVMEEAYSMNCEVLPKPYKNQDLIDRVRQSIFGSSSQGTSPQNPQYA